MVAGTQDAHVLEALVVVVTLTPHSSHFALEALVVVVDLAGCHWSQVRVVVVVVALK